MDWIKASEKLPEIEGRYLCTLEYKRASSSEKGYDIDYKVDIVNFYKNELGWNVSKYKVVAWQSLPEPFMKKNKIRISETGFYLTGVPGELGKIWERKHVYPVGGDYNCGIAINKEDMSILRWCEGDLYYDKFDSYEDFNESLVKYRADFS